MANGPISSEDLRLGIERIERLEEEKRGIAEDIKDVYSEYKSKGFCTKTMRRIVALRKLTPDDRREMEAMLDLYKGALGMLDGTPLGRWALERLEKEDAEEQPSPDGGDAEAEAPEQDGDDTPADPPEPEPTIEDARQAGMNAAREGRPVTSNPFPARDLRRAAWDEAWCQELGSDGMDIPDALKPAPKPKKGSTAPAEAPAPDSDGAAGAEGDA